MKKIDFHVHIEKNIPIEQSEYYFRDMCERHGYSGINILSYCYATDNSKGYSETCNEEALELKERMGKDSCAFGCLLPGIDYARQAEELMNSGFDGIKLLRGGKPNYYRKFHSIYDDHIYEDFFALAEEKQYPIIMHNNDPAYSWDISKAPERAIKMGWVYDNTVPSHERYYTAVDNVLERHPNLKVAFAHMGFYTEDLSRAFKMMEKYPNIYMDITPAINIYTELSANHDEAELFFKKYNDRIFFGTDATNLLVGEAREFNDLKNEITSHFLCGNELRVFGHRSIDPIGLDKASLENIYYNNAMNFIRK